MTIAPDPTLAASLSAAYERLPLFPLPRTTLLPHTLQPLHVFEPRYRALIGDLLQGDGLLGIPQLAPGFEADYAGRPALLPVMGVGRVLRAKAYDDGRYDILVGGLTRVRLVEELVVATPYRQVRVVALPELEPTTVPALQRSLQQIRYQLLSLAQHRPDQQRELRTLAELGGCPKELLDGLAGMAIRRAEERQAYLERDRITERAELVLASLIELNMANQAEACEA